MHEVRAVTAHVPGSVSAKTIIHNEIKVLTVNQGLSHFYLTINLADVYNPLVWFLAGKDINPDTILPGDFNYFEQASIVAKNPFVVSRFFNIFMKAFIHAVLGYNPKKRNTEGGILGKVKAYYGCVEAQGRGSLHCHMLVWVEGGLNVDEIKCHIVNKDDNNFQRRLISFLDNTISNEIPPSNVETSEHDPCTICGPIAETSEELQKDLHLLVKQCQQHSHTHTCFKYDKNSCRFSLDVSNFASITMYDVETGTLTMCCLDGLVNNFTATILHVI